MAEVGVLNLQVRAESSEQATQSLRQLAGALQRVRNAVKGGINLSAVGTSVERFAEKVNNSINEAVIGKIHQLGEALSKLNSANNLSNVTINIKDGNVAQVKTTLDEIKETTSKSIMGVASDDARRAADAFMTVVDQGELLENQIDELKVKLGTGLIEGTIDETKAGKIVSQIERLEGKLGKVREKIEDASETAKTVEEPLAETFEKVSEVAENASDSIADLRRNTESTIGIVKGLEKAVEDGRFRPSMYGPALPGGVKDQYSSKTAPTDIMESTIHAANLRGENGPQAYYDALWEEWMRTGEESIQAVHERLEALKEELWKAQPSPIAQEIKELMASLERLNPSGITDDKFLGKYIDNMMGIGAQAKSAKESAAVFEEAFRKMELAANGLDIQTVTAGDIVNMDEADLLTMKLESMQSALQDDIENNRLSTQQMADRAMQIQKLQDKLDKLRDSQRQATDATHGFRDALEEIKESTVSSRLGKLVTQFMRIAKTRAIRYVIKEISAGFSEGLENVYRYSDAINGRFAESMDNAASSLLTMKNSIGAAVAPVITALIPYLKIVVNWFITLINYVNQFFALLNGQSTWTHAVAATTSAYEDQTDAAQSASAAVKDLLADWDELNIIQSDTSSGSGLDSSNVGEDYLNMFEQVATFENRIKEIVSFIKENFDRIKKAALDIAAAILSWKVSTLFSGFLSQIFGIAAAGLTAKIIFDVVTMFDEQYLKTGNAGWLVGNVLTTLVGSFFMKQILETVLGGGKGEIGIPIALAVSATADITTLLGNTDVSALSKESLTLAVISALKAGGAAAYLGYKVFGFGKAVSLMGGTATAITTFGVVIGIKSVIQTAKSGVTAENVEAAALSSLSLGIGAGLFAKLLGASALGALGAGAVAAGLAIVTLSAGIAIAASINASKDDIKWGTQKLTEEEIEEFVNAEMFDINVKATIGIISDKVSLLAGERTKMQTTLQRALGTWKVIRLGMATSQDYESMRADVNSLVEEINGYIAEAKEAGKLVIQYTPTLAGGTGDEQNAWYKGFTSGWDAVDKFAENAGRRIGELLIKKENETLEAGEAKILETLMNQLANVTSAISEAKVNSAAMANLQLSIGDVDQASFESIAEAYDNYRKELTEQYKALVSEAYTMQGQLVAALFEIKDESPENQRLYEEAKAKYEEMGAGLAEAVKDGVDSASASGSEMVLQMLKEKYGDSLKKYMSEGDFTLNLFDFIRLNSDMSEDTDVQAMTSIINGFISSLLGDVNEDLVRYIEKFGFSAWEMLPDEMKAQVEAALREAINNDEIVNQILNQFGEKNPVETALTEWGDQWHAEGSGDILPDIEYDVDVVEDDSLNTPVQAPGIDNTEFERTLNERVDAARIAAQRIQEYLSMFAGAAPYTGTMSGWNETSRPAAAYASGGVVRSGDLVMANENGNFEMMGRMGRQPVVANNQQIVDGISKGVSSANGTMVGEMRNMVTLMQRMLNKEFVAKAVPSSAWGRNNNKSADAYSKVTG